MLFVVSGPSAVGKNSVVNEILKIDRTIGRIVTCTTREMRKSEQHGVDYFFIPKNDFLLEMARGNLIEFSEVYGNYYGVMFSAVEEKINSGEDSILVINWEGFLKIKNAIKTNVYGIFILPPSIEDLESRIKIRGEDSPEAIKRRISMARKDIAKADLYDFCFENVDMVATAKSILEKINDIRHTSP
ncbi:MAG: guanylate kinase [Holosporaceae bacterium]|nr:guanylate kinase [Holosporaceae bacterium]